MNTSRESPVADRSSVSLSSKTSMIEMSSESIRSTCQSIMAHRSAVVCARFVGFVISRYASCSCVLFFFCHNHVIFNCLQYYGSSKRPIIVHYRSTMHISYDTIYTHTHTHTHTHTCTHALKNCAMFFEFCVIEMSSSRWLFTTAVYYQTIG